MDSVYLALIGIGGTLLGVFLTSLFNFLNTRQIQRSEQRKHLRDIIVRMGFDYWQQQLELAKLLSEASGQKVDIVPPETYVLHMMKFIEMIDEKEINVDNVEEKLTELMGFSNRVTETLRALGSRSKAKKT